MMISRAPSAAAGRERRIQHVSVACAGLQARPVRPVPGAAASPRPGTPRPPVGRPAGGAAPSGRAAEYNWWGAGARQAAAAAPRRQQRSSWHGAGRPAARVPTGKGNRELVRRALTPPAARGHGRGRGAPVLTRRWSFRPAPSRLRNASSLSSPSPVSPRTRPL